MSLRKLDMAEKKQKHNISCELFQRREKNNHLLSATPKYLLSSSLVEAYPIICIE